MMRGEPVEMLLVAICASTRSVKNLLIGDLDGGGR